MNFFVVLKSWEKKTKKSFSLNMVEEELVLQDGFCYKAPEAITAYKKKKLIFQLTAIEKRMENFQTQEAVTRRCSVKKMFLEISQNSQENTCARVSFLIKLHTWPATLLK